MSQKTSPRRLDRTHNAIPLGVIYRLFVFSFLHSAMRSQLQSIPHCCICTSCFTLLWLARTQAWQNVRPNKTRGVKHRENKCAALHCVQKMAHTKQCLIIQFGLKVVLSIAREHSVIRSLHRLDELLVIGFILFILYESIAALLLTH